MVTRRLFITASAAGVLTLWAGAPNSRAEKIATVTPPGRLPATDITQFVTPLLVPPVMPRSGTSRRRGGKNADLYDISVRQFEQQILPVGNPKTKVWGFGPRLVAGTSMHHAPSFTIESDATRPVRVRWTNELVDGEGKYLPHLLPVDPTLHWANPGRRRNAAGDYVTDTRPSFEGLTYVPPEEFFDPETQYTLYAGPVPWVTHVHGAMGVGEESDGYPEAWFLPAATNLEGYATTGRWYSHFSAISATKLGQAWGAGHSISEYPVANRASTMWYHDHTLGMTRLNVYAGPAGFFIVRGGAQGDKTVLDNRTGAMAVFPGPAPKEGDRGAKTYREIPIAIQDRSFNDNGSLFYPDTRAFFDGFEGPYVPAATGIAPAWQPEFFGDTLIANGATWPYLTVQKARYRFRLLNGCNSRFLVLDFSSVPGATVTQIGNDGGFLSAPHDVSGIDGGRIVMAPAERVDLIVDFTATPVGNHVLTNVGPDEPYGGGVPGTDFPSADPETTGQVLQFRVVAATVPDPSTPGMNLVLPARRPLPAHTVTRRLALLEHLHVAGEDEAPVAAMLGTIAGNPGNAPVETMHQMWESAVTENPAVGATEVWEVYNATADAHPVHIHEVAFEVVNRQTITVDDEKGTVQVEPGSAAVPPNPGETGVKDTVVALPNEVTRIKAAFNTRGQYVWHCHIVEHEDNEMMRPFRVGPADPDAPA